MLFPAVDFTVGFSLALIVLAVLGGSRLPWHAAASAAILYALIQIAALAGFGLYANVRARVSAPTLDEVGRIVGALTVATWVFFLGASAAGRPSLSAGKLALVWAVTVPSIAAARFALRRLSLSARGGEPTLILGAGAVGQSIALKLLEHPRSGVDVVGFVDPHPRALIDPRLGVIPIHGDLEQFESVLDRTGARRIVIAFSHIDTAAALSIVRTCDRRGIDVDVVPRLYELFANKPRVDAVCGIPLLGLPPVRPSYLDELAKRALDMGVSAVLLVLLAPVFALISIAIRLDSPGPAIFRHVRVGRHGRLFKMVKFRTMLDGADERQEWMRARHGSSAPKEPRDSRVTRVGRILRRTSLDELPQVWNVLLGHMSLVGPRPLPVYEFVGQPGVDGMRIEVRPGLTGLWQVLGRSDIDFEERMALDYLYARNRSLAWDLRLLAETVGAAVRGKGAY